MPPIVDLEVESDPRAFSVLVGVAESRDEDQGVSPESATRTLDHFPSSSADVSGRTA
jgi:hypothetical protein